MTLAEVTAALAANHRAPRSIMEAHRDRAMSISSKTAMVCTPLWCLMSTRLAFTMPLHLLSTRRYRVMGMSVHRRDDGGRERPCTFKGEWLHAEND
jgi:hypothetical protein